MFQRIFVAALAALLFCAAPAIAQQAGIWANGAPAGECLISNSSGVATFQPCPTSTASGNFIPSPGGRVTLQQGYPVQQADEPAATALYYDCTGDKPPYVPIPNGSGFTAVEIPACELALPLAPSIVTAGNIYDDFLTLSNGALAWCVGAPYSSGTRSGFTLTHGAFHLHQTLGLWTNADVLPHCYGGTDGTVDYGPIAVDSALWVHSFEATANGETAQVMMPTPVMGGNNNYCVSFNVYNRVAVTCRSEDANSSWASQSPSPSHPVPCDNAEETVGLNRINFIDPLGEHRWRMGADASITASGIGYWALIGIGLDTTAGVSGTGGHGAFVEQQAAGSSGNWGTRVHGDYQPPGALSVGQHYAQCMEYSGQNPQGQSYYTGFAGQDYMRVTLDGWM